MATKQSGVVREQNGFALLMTLIVVSVVVSIGLSVLDLSIKQSRLTTSARDSETAFHAANAGVECARYWRRERSDEMEHGEQVAGVSCFGATPLTLNPITLSNSEAPGDGEVYKYLYDFSWGSGVDARCTSVTTMVATATALVGASLGRGVTTTAMTNHIPSFPEATWFCGAGERCTVISVRGYNRPCSAGEYGPGTVEREVLLQF